MSQSKRVFYFGAVIGFSREDRLRTELPVIETRERVSVEELKTSSYGLR